MTGLTSLPCGLPGYDPVCRTYEQMENKMPTPYFEFQSSLYRNAREVADAITFTWLTANGSNSSDDISGFLADHTDAELADEAIETLGLNACQNEEAIRYDGAVPVTWLGSRGLSRDALTAAFTRFREDRPDLTD